MKTLLLILALGLTEAEHARSIAKLPDIVKEGNVQIEHVLWDRTRVDIETDLYAYEVDWAYKWAEGIGQALYYGIVTKKRPGLILLVKKGEGRFVYRAQTVCSKFNIKLKVVKVK